jgi:phosphatidylserine decarboxylase
MVRDKSRKTTKANKITKANRTRKRATRRHSAKRSRALPPYLMEPFLVLRTALETDATLRALVSATLAHGQAPPSWRGKTLLQFIDFFKQWANAKISLKNPGYYIGHFAVLMGTAKGRQLMRYAPWTSWVMTFFETRHEYLGSPSTRAWVPHLVTATPPGGGGFNMQMIPADKDGTAGPSMEGSPYQRALIKKYRLNDKLITRNGTQTLDLPKALMTKLFKFNNFNRFFLRRFLPETRPLGASPSWLPAGRDISPKDAIVSPADGQIKWLFHEGSSGSTTRKFLVKEQVYSLHEAFTVCSLEAAHRCTANKYLDVFANGPMVDILLWFTDYHRYHAPVSGKVIKIQDYGLPSALGATWGDGPAGLAKEDRDWVNKHYGARMEGYYDWTDTITKHRRAVYIIDTDVRGGTRVGKVMMMPIGFYGVGSMVSRVKEGQMITKGQELGNFAFGGSSVILCFEPKKVEIDVPYVASKSPYPQTASAFQPIQVRQAIGSIRRARK